MANAVYDPETGEERSSNQPDLGPGHDRPSSKTYDPRQENAQSGRSADPRGQGPDKLKDVRDGEQNPKSGSEDSEDDDNSEEDDNDAENKWFTDKDNDKPKKGWFKATKRKTATAAAIGVIGFAGIFGTSSILHGPAQLMQLSEILKRPFTSQDDANENRIKGLLRYARSGEVGETRVSWFGSRSYSKTMAKYKEMGITVEKKTRGAGRPIAYKVDLSESNSYTGLSREAAVDKFCRDTGFPKERITYGANPTRNIHIFYAGDPNSNTALPVDVDKALNKHWISNIADGKGHVVTALKGRAVSRFNGNYSWFHPIKRIQSNLMDKAAEWDRVRQEKKAVRKEKAKARVSKLKEKVKPAAGVVGVASTAALGICVARDIAHETPLLSYENVRQPAQNAALEAIAMGDQLKSNQDFNFAQPGAVANGLIDKDGKNPWQGKAFNALTYGGAGKGTDLDSDVKSSFGSNNDAAEIESAINSSGGSAVCSTVGQLALGAVGLVALAAAAPSGGGSIAVYTTFAVGSTAATIGAVTAITTIVPKLLADKPLLAEAKYLAGPQAGNIMAFGSQDMANSFFRKSGGAQLSENATAALDKKEQIADRKDFQSKSMFARVFDTHDYRSLISRTVIQNNFSPSQGLSNVATSVLSLNTLGSRIFSSFMPHVGAAEKPYDFGFPKYGFSEEDLNNPLMADPYANADQAAKLLDSNPSYIDRAEKCFGVVLSKGDHGWQVDLVDNQDSDPDKEVIPNTAKYIDSNCAEGSDDWLRIRLFIFDSRTMEAYACLEEDDNDACLDAGIDGNTGTASSPEPASVSIDPNFKMKKLSTPIKEHHGSGTITPKGITLHWWGNQFGNGIQPLVDTFHQNSYAVQVGITSDGDVYQMMDHLNDYASHATGGNSTTIGIEIEGGPGEFTKESITKYPKKFAAVVATVKYLMKKYNIPVNGQVKCGDVVGIHPHSAYNNCPLAAGKDDIDHEGKDTYYYDQVIKKVQE